MKNKVYIVRYAEIALKGKNRNFFEKKLARNIKECLKKNKIGYEKVVRLRNRIIIYSRENCDAVRNVFGISSLSKAIEIEPEMEMIKKVILIVIVLAIAGGSYWFLIGNKATDEEISKLIETANASGSDIFMDQTSEDRKNVFNVFKKITSSEIERLTALIATGEQKWTPADANEFTKLMEKASGKRMGS